MARSFSSGLLCESTNSSNGLGAAQEEREIQLSLKVPPDWEVTHLASDSKADITEHILTTWNKKEERGIILVICLLTPSLFAELGNMQS